MEPYKVPQPSSIPDESRASELFKFFLDHNSEVDSLWRKTSQPYYPWKKFESAFKSGYFGKFWAEKKVIPEEAWFLLGVRRTFGSNVSPINDTNGSSFTWVKLPGHERMLHDFDMQLGGYMATDKGSAAITNQQRFLRQSLIEEAIASSQLEGAATTRERAKKMFAENRKPISPGEWRKKPRIILFLRRSC
jgi:hypothetical protein